MNLFDSSLVNLPQDQKLRDIIIRRSGTLPNLQEEIAVLRLRLGHTLLPFLAMTRMGRAL